MQGESAMKRFAKFCLALAAAASMPQFAVMPPAFGQSKQEPKQMGAVDQRPKLPEVTAQPGDEEGTFVSL
jgi:hypothetical protein